MPILGQISRLVILLVAGLVLTALVDLPARTLPLIVLDSPLTLELSSPWLLAIVLAILVSAGADVLLRLRLVEAGVGFRDTAPAWGLPGVMAAAAALLLVKFEPLSPGWLFILAGTGALVSLALLGEAGGAGPANRYQRVARTTVTVLTYGVALLVFTLVYRAHLRTVLSGTATSLTGLVLAMSLLRRPANGHGNPASPAAARYASSEGRRLWPYAAATALTVGLTTWALNHMGLDGVVGGGLILLVFYASTGVAQHMLHGGLSRRVAVEFAVAVILGLLLLLASTALGN